MTRTTKIFNCFLCVVLISSFCHSSQSNCNLFIYFLFIFQDIIHTAPQEYLRFCSLFLLNVIFFQDIIHSTPQKYGEFLQHCIPNFTKVLTDTPPQFESDSNIQVRISSIYLILYLSYCWNKTICTGIISK